MTSGEIRKLYLEFFEKKGHKTVLSSSLIPDDESVLLTTAGMQQFKKYYTGELDAKKDFILGNGEPAIGVASIQKCFRTSDIDEVGDDTHLTSFEMLGNFSFGGYFKKEAIEYAYEFIVKNLGLKIDYVSVFGGDQETAADFESERFWEETKKKHGENFEIKKFGKKDNFWGPTGDEGPCGPTTEIYINDVEVWNIVFNEYYRNKDGKFTKLETPGVDTGMGLERVLAALNGFDDNYKTDLFSPIIRKIEELSGKKYGESSETTRAMRIIADHIKAATFILGDEKGLTPSNVGAGYVLRRLIRRAVRNGFSLGAKETFTSKIAEEAVKIYQEVYPEMGRNKDFITSQLIKEEEKFGKTLDKGLKKLKAAVKKHPWEFQFINEGTNISVSEIFPAFYFYQTFGFPIEMIKEEFIIYANKLSFSVPDSVVSEVWGKIEKYFYEEFKEHQELSRTASTGMFKGGLADASEQTIKYHTAAHLMLAALRQVFGENVLQKGSNITSERLRFDFSHPEKMTPEQIKQVEDLVNEKIKQGLPVICEELSLEEAKEKGAMGVFDSKYGERVKVYTIGNPSTGSESAFSREICGGPHVSRTSELGKFKIIKEESASAGVRRIKAILE